MMTKRLLSLFFLLPLLLLTLLFPPQTYAATFRNGESVTVTEPLTDLYSFGSTVTIDAPVRNDLTIAGGTVTVNDRVTGDLLAAGGNLSIDGEIGNTVRAAGGSIRITRPVHRDVVVAGGTVTLDETASVSGDLIVSGGTVNVQAPVRGNVYVNGGQVTLNAPVGGSVHGDVGTLILGRDAVINGDLTYTSGQRATLRDGAVIRGQENYTPGEKQNDRAGKGLAAAFTGLALYKLIADILASLALIYLLYLFTRRIVETGAAEPLKNGLLGFAGLILIPILGVFLLVLLLPGILTFLFYGVLLILAAYLSKILLGWLLLRWWYGRDNHVYLLDWKAAVLGPIVMFLLMLIPVLGWFIGFILFLIALGALITSLFSWVSSPRPETVREARPHRAAVAAPRTTTRPTRKAAPRRRK